MRSSSKILLLDNKSDLTQDLQQYLSREFGVVDLLYKSGEALETLREKNYDLLILSINFDDMKGVEFIRIIRRKVISPPFIMLGSDGDIKLAVEAMKEGAVDFIHWSNNKEALYPYITEIIRKVLKNGEMGFYSSGGKLIYKTLFDNLRDAVFLHIIDAETLTLGEFLEVNPTACSRLGYTHREFSTMTPLDIDASELEENSLLIKELIERGSIIFKTYHKTKDGRKIPVEINARLFDFWGNSTVLSVARNIIDQQKVLDDLKNSELSFRSIIAGCIVGISITDEDGIFEFVNEEYCNIFGYNPEEMIGYHFTIIVPDEFKKRMTESYDHFFRERKRGAKMKLPMIDKQGNEKYIVVDAICIKDIKGRQKRVTFVEDITEERKARKALKLSEMKYRTMMESLQDPVCISDQNCRIIYVNKAFKKRFGALSKNEKCHKIIFGSKEPCQLCLETKENLSRYRKRKEATINKRVYQATMVPIQYENISNAKMIILRDVTKVVKARRRAEESDRLKSAFLANISHEIRTPLNAVLGFSNLLKDDQITKDETLMYVDMINESSNHLLHVMDNIIEFSFIDSGLVQVHPVEIKTEKVMDDLKRETLLLKEKMNKSDLYFKVENQLPEGFKFTTDESRIRQILLNFLSNAFKFTEKGGVSLSVSYNNKWVVFSVKDTGIGIPPKMHNVIFRRFRQADEGHTRMFGGNGMGLALCKHLAQILCGHIKLKSSPGKGAEFQLYIPDKFDESLARLVSSDFVK
jgi:PAS domain S-box-containing protein